MANQDCWPAGSLTNAVCERYSQNWKDWLPVQGIADFLTGDASLWVPKVELSSGSGGGTHSFEITYSTEVEANSVADTPYPKGVYIPGPVQLGGLVPFEWRALLAAQHYVRQFNSIFLPLATGVQPMEVCELWDSIINRGGVSFSVPVFRIVYSRRNIRESGVACYVNETIPKEAPGLLDEQVVRCFSVQVFPTFQITGAGQQKTQSWIKLGGRRKRIAGRSAEKVVTKNGVRSRGPSNWVRIHRDWKTGRKFTRQTNRTIANPRRQALKGVRKGTGCPEDKPSRFREGVKFGKKVIGKAIKAALKTAAKKTGAKVKKRILNALKRR